MAESDFQRYRYLWVAAFVRYSGFIADARLAINAISLDLGGSGSKTHQKVMI